VFISIQTGNLANDPDNPGTSSTVYWENYSGPPVADNWSAGTNYIPGDLVYITTTLYLAILASLNHTPPNVTYWIAPASATVAVPFNVTNYTPIGYEPTGTTIRTLYTLPNGYLRIAPQEPKQPAVLRLTTTAGVEFTDWEIESKFLTSTVNTKGIVFRYVADVTSVPRMDDMFCEGLAARMGMELNERMTQNPQKFEICSNAYKLAIDTARRVSAIEAGSTEEDFPEPQSAGAQPQQRGR